MRRCQGAVMTGPQDTSGSNPALARVKALLERMRQAERPCPYTAQPCLSEPQLKLWETVNRVSLPEEYRLFLLEVGNGGNMPSDYCDFEVWALGTGPTNPALLQPFPITKQRLQERQAQYKPDEASFMPELDEFWENGVQPPGCLDVAQYPSYEGISLVVTGELRGSLWAGVAGWRPEMNRQGELFGFLG